MSPRTSKLDLDAAAAFLATVPEGHWTSYGDVAVAGGRSSSAAQGVASWIGSKGHRLKNVHRVLNGDGEISAAWTPAGEGLPANASEVSELLLREGVRITNGRADPDQRWRPLAGAAPEGARGVLETDVAERCLSRIAGAVRQRSCRRQATFAVTGRAAAGCKAREFQLLTRPVS